MLPVVLLRVCYQLLRSQVLYAVLPFEVELLGGSTELILEHPLVLQQLKLIRCHETGLGLVRHGVQCLLLVLVRPLGHGLRRAVV